MTDSSKGKKTAKRATSKKAATKKVQRKEDGTVKIVFLNRKEDAIAEVRGAISDLNLIDEFKNIRTSYIDLFEESARNAHPKHEDAAYMRIRTGILDTRYNQALKLLNKLAPDFRDEDVNAALDEAKNNANNFNADTAREEGYSKLAKAIEAAASVKAIK